MGHFDAGHFAIGPGVVVPDGDKQLLDQFGLGVAALHRLARSVASTRLEVETLSVSKAHIPALNRYNVAKKKMASEQTLKLIVDLSLQMLGSREASTGVSAVTAAR